MDVVLPLLLLELVLVIDELVRRCDDFLLPPRKRFGRIILIAATATSATLLTLAVFAAERPDFDEINVGRNRVRGVPCVYGFSVVGDQVPGLQVRLRGRLRFSRSRPLLQPAGR